MQGGRALRRKGARQSIEVARSEAEQSGGREGARALRRERAMQISEEGGNQEERLCGRERGRAVSQKGGGVRAVRREGGGESEAEQ